VSRFSLSSANGAGGARYDVERLMRQYGWDAKLTDLLARLTGAALGGAQPASMRGAKLCTRGGTTRTLTIEGGYSSKLLCVKNTPAIKIASKPTIARKPTTIHIAVCMIFNSQPGVYVCLGIYNWEYDACSVACLTRP
jgi:hypothetical protein